ncbi:hypothetical protein AVEN_214323-1 [Araneus ventricosus]|uniref:Uncharacterized protein n=1 Tax=Araneus ventricosus TaxID=182803 RepID=A0A4Y2M445_ARAVE|nr:hypothetical protein AVEN_214323-1 [Araneus ventricosus]
MEALLLEEEALALILLNKQIQKKKRNRRFWTHKIVQLRGEAGLFANLYRELRNDDEKFFDFLRMSIALFDELLGHIKDKIKKKDTVMRSSITPEERLVITLR